MNTKTPFLIILLLAVLVSLAGCKKTNAPSQSAAPQTTTSAAAQEQYHHPEGGTTPVAETKFFKGSIGSSLGLQMKLVRTNDQLN